MECFKNNEYKFTINEYNALQRITSINKMDTWFSIRPSKDGLDYIYDLEENKRLSITNALSYIYDGLLEEDYFQLDKEEQKALEQLFERFL